MLDIETHRSEVAQLCRRLRVKRLDVFGSATTTRYGPTNDIDFLVEFDQAAGKRFERYFELKEGLEALFLRPADLVTIEAMRNHYFIAAVDESRRPLYVA
ncbi:MAG: nucleotidyltransferase domain-containing protein [Ardenticatenales bacterium]|nr:nucleotidyltransferase domain-containing protein [Ardenticatenales bacterium]